MVVESLIEFGFNVLFRASIYLLVALGLSIVFGSLQYVNMAHGVLFLAGGYLGLLVGFELTFGGALSSYGDIGLGLGIWGALILVPVLVFFLGVVMERVLAKPFYDRPLLDQLLVTFGVLLALSELFGEVFGKSSLLYPREDYLIGAFSVPGLGTPPGFGSVSTIRVIAVVLTLVFLALILAFYRYTDFGLAVRAGTEDAEMTELLGIRVGRPFLLIFAIGAAYAGVAGVLDGFQFNVGYLGGVEIIIPALVIVIMGGVGSIRGTIVASFLAGLTVAAVNLYMPSMSRISIYALAILVLTIRPNGIYPKEEIAA